MANSLLVNLKLYIHNVGIGLDQFVNAIVGGDPDETLSSRMGKSAAKGHRWWGWVHDALDYFWPNHCKKAIDKTEGKDEIIW